MHDEKSFVALQRFGLILKKINATFCVLFGEIESSLQK